MKVPYSHWNVWSNCESLWLVCTRWSWYIQYVCYAHVRARTHTHSQHHLPCTPFIRPCPPYSHTGVTTVRHTMLTSCNGHPIHPLSEEHSSKVQEFLTHTHKHAYSQVQIQCHPTCNSCCSGSAMYGEALLVPLSALVTELLCLLVSW